MAPLDEKKHDEADEEAELSLHFHLDDVKSSLSDVKIKVDEIWMGEIRPRASRGSRGSRDSKDSCKSNIHEEWTSR